MNILKKEGLRFSFALLLMSLLFVTGVNAEYSSLSLSPSTGTIYGDSTPITVVINSGSDEFYGVDADLSFTGPVTYLGGTGGARCSTFRVSTLADQKINIECISTGHAEGETYSGTVAVLNFKATAAGTAVLTFDRYDPSTIPSVSGGTYNLSTDTTPGGTTTPKTGLFDDTRSIIIGGGILVFLGLFFNQLGGFGFSLFNTLGKGAKSIKVGVVSGIEKSKGRSEERRISKRRGKLEKEF